MTEWNRWPCGWFESLTTNGLRCYSGWGLDSRFHGNDGVGPLAVRVVREPHHERATPRCTTNGLRQGAPRTGYAKVRREQARQGAPRTGYAKVRRERATPRCATNGLRQGAPRTGSPECAANEVHFVGPHPKSLPQGSGIRFRLGDRNDECRGGTGKGPISRGYSAVVPPSMTSSEPVM